MKKKKKKKSGGGLSRVASSPCTDKYVPGIRYREGELRFKRGVCQTYLKTEHL